MSEGKASRVERDYFGEVEIPDGKRYGVLTVRAMENLSFSGEPLAQKESFIRAMLEVKKAAAMMNMRTAELSEAKGQAIMRACDALLDARDYSDFVVDAYHGGGGIATNVNVNEVVAHVAGVTVRATEDVNASQSTADACHTALHIALYREFAELDVRLLGLVDVTADVTARFAEIETISRTCMQDAMRIRQGERFSGYTAVLKRRRDKIRTEMPRLLTVNLGKTVLGSGVGASDAYRDGITACLRDVTGLPLVMTANGFDTAQNVDLLADLADVVKLYAETLIKFCQDLRFLSSGPEAGIGELILPAFMAGSTFFPGKVNPVVPETVMQGAFSIIGKIETIHLCYRHSDTDLNVFEHMAGMTLMEAIAELGAITDLLGERCLKDITANQAKCAEYANALIPLVVDLKAHYSYTEVQTLLTTKTKTELVEILKGVTNR
ncbi:lyase family protein [Listeria booriae]|uniref:lyase family protein n=1 Tax=Listeria booriae TaxID=1552123 RepID=UPI0016234803|nr:lyase family protein [Listeria booriae]MBC2322515.1 aspartate ammonia-lyase [Listeria booriae]MCD2206479.1 aspartate ammonia-lyase [Listeria booriae]